MKGVKGKNCDSLFSSTDKDLCASNPCWSGGTCISLNNDWRCSCLPGFTGNYSGL